MVKKLPDEILFLLGKREFRPDILGKVRHPIGSRAFYYFDFFISAEIKTSPPTLDDVFQAKKYGEIYGCAISLLVSTDRPEERLLRFLKKKSTLLLLPMSGYHVYLCRFSVERDTIDWWFPEAPRREQHTS